MSTNYLEVGRIIKDFFKANPELLKGLTKKLKLDPNKFTSKSHLSKRDEHQEWFIGNFHLFHHKCKFYEGYSKILNIRRYPKIQHQRRIYGFEGRNENKELLEQS